MEEKNVLIKNYSTMNEDFLEQLFQTHKKAKYMPSPDSICRLTNGILAMMFPVFTEKRYRSKNDINDHYMSLQFELKSLLNSMKDRLVNDVEFICNSFFAHLPEIHHSLVMDAEAIANGDPAAENSQEVIRTYPGFYAISIYRMAHELYRLKVPFLPRILTENAHSKTGIDIHPGAQIGKNFFIDHGTGIVVGESCIIGDNVKIYQGVTLGALSVSKNLASTKRHPTIEDEVVIYANATILGGETTIGKKTTIGGNVWVTRSVPANSLIYHQAQVKMKTSEN